MTLGVLSPDLLHVAATVRQAAFFEAVRKAYGWAMEGRPSSLGEEGMRVFEESHSLACRPNRATGLLRPVNVKCRPHKWDVGTGPTKAAVDLVLDPFDLARLKAMQRVCAALAGHFWAPPHFP